VVWITPIITRSKEGLVVPELGAGGGGGDLHQVSELEISDIGSLGDIEELCRQLLKNEDHLRAFLSKFECAVQAGDLKMHLYGLDLGPEREIPLREFFERLLTSDHFKQPTGGHPASYRPRIDGGGINDVIEFPFSRHSSYNELCDLVAAFKPLGIYPCTVEEETWTEEVSMRVLFGHLCSGAVFDHDEKMKLLVHGRLEKEGPPRKKQKRNNKESRASSLIESTSQEYNTAASVEIQAQIQDGPATHPRLNEISLVTSEDSSATQGQSLSANLAAVKAAYDAHMARATDESSSSAYSDDD
jgi:DNA cross-link repair 1C protein